MKFSTLIALLAAVSAAPVNRQAVAADNNLLKREPRVVIRTHTADPVFVTNVVTAPAVTVTAGQEPAPAPEPQPEPTPAPAPAPGPESQAPAPAPQPSEPAPAPQPSSAAPAPPAPQPVEPSAAPEPTSQTPPPQPTSQNPPPAPTSQTPEPATSQTPDISVTTFTTSIPDPTPTSSSTAEASPTLKPNGILPYSLTYSPYNDDSSCKNIDEVTKDLKEIVAKGIKVIRVYGTDCGSVQTIEPVAKQLGLKINQGFWIGPDGVDSIDAGVKEFIDWVQQNDAWGMVDTITVGNEAIIAGYVSPQDLIGKIGSVKNQLKAAGYQGQVTTAEPAVSYSKHPELCTGPELDYVGINSHAYFNPDQSPETAGQFALDEMSLTRKTCNNKIVFVTETGYPSAGNTNGNNVPTPENQDIAINSLLKALNGYGTFFTMYNDFWKAPGPYNVEQHFGIINILQ
ncbi:putative family 17 glucosidase SCW11 [Yarrowia sp. B02]|nr:putative family 17 glucosidase SCW11 [Yarrowia sp. B02]